MQRRKVRKPTEILTLGVSLRKGRSFAHVPQYEKLALKMYVHRAGQLPFLG